jgi:peptidoglycan/xylan/chitin deacetylase (PgdA/CDA1 family)
LTIDDGPALPWTSDILALLTQHNVTATFCMIGASVARYPTIARSVAEGGHAIANHTWDHADLTGADASRVRAEIDRTQEVIEDATGRTPAFFRAPYGAWSPAVIDTCADLRLRPLGWSVDPQDWARPSISVIASRILASTRPGSIVLEHDGGGDRSQTVAALRVVLPRLLDEGFTFVTP